MMGGPPPPASTPSDSGETRNDVHLLDWMTISLGFVGGAGASFLDKPTKQSVRGLKVKPEYPGFSGLATVVGPTLELRFMGYFGVELGVLSASESGSAAMTVDDPNTGKQSSFDIVIGHSAVHVPLLFKAVAPGKLASPMLFLGPMFVMPGSAADFGIENGENLSELTYSAYTESYAMFTFGIGMEVNLPVDGADLRIPLLARGAFNPGVSDSREERARQSPETGTVTEESLSTQFKYHAVGEIGLALHF